MECMTSARNFLGKRGANHHLHIHQLAECPEKLMWYLSASDSFTIKNAYSLVLSLKGCKELEASATTEHSQFWKSIWNLKVSEKEKNFL